MDVHIVAFETSTSRCDVALLSCVQGRTLVISRHHDGAAEHAQHVLPMVDALLREAGLRRSQLTAVAFGQGPGGFTGLRVACGLTQGMAFALSIPVVPVPSLLAIAAQDQFLSAGAPAAVRVVLQDARMGELYAAAYRRDAHDARWITVRAPCLLARDDVARWLTELRSGLPQAGREPLHLRLLGDGAAAFPDLAALPGFDSVGGEIAPQAGSVAALAHAAWLRGDAIDAAQAAPLYVRDKVAYTSREREGGLGGNPKAAPVAPACLPQESMTIVPMADYHLPLVTEIERTTQAHPWTEGNFQDALKAGYGAWVALLDGKVAGFCLLMLAPDVAHLLLIAVDRQYQRKGVGSGLLLHALGEAGEHGLPSVVLEVRPSNTTARAFYRDHGFTQLAVRKDYYPALNGQREDALVLQKILLTEDMSCAAGGGARL